MNIGKKDMPFNAPTWILGEWGGGGGGGETRRCKFVVEKDKSKNLV